MSVRKKYHFYSTGFKLFCIVVVVIVAPLLVFWVGHTIPTAAVRASFRGLSEDESEALSNRLSLEGTYGDSFGMVNALVSAAAFGAVIVTLFFQMQEYQLALRERKELLEHNEDMAEAQLFSAYINALNGIRELSSSVREKLDQRDLSLSLGQSIELEVHASRSLPRVLTRIEASYREKYGEDSTSQDSRMEYVSSLIGLADELTYLLRHWKESIAFDALTRIEDWNARLSYWRKRVSDDDRIVIDNLVTDCLNRVQNLRHNSADWMTHAFELLCIARRNILELARVAYHATPSTKNKML